MMNISPDFSQPRQEGHVHAGLGKRILIVDDHETVLLYLTDRLERLGFVVSTATNGQEGMRLLQEQVFHGVLLDLEMSVMDGLTMLSHLQKQANDIPVIVMSADPTRTAMIKAIEAGARDYLTKPISNVILKYKCLRLFA
ncbi:MAG: response regulator [Nitrospirales bacterium]